MTTGAFIREARKRADLSQTELAERLGRPQSSVARWETGRRVPSLEVLRGVVAACGLELALGLAKADDSYDWPIDRQLALAPGERLEAMLGGTGFDPLAVLRALADAEAAYVLIGEVAAALRGCPLTLDRRVLALVPGGGATVDAALEHAGATRMSVEDEFGGVQTIAPWALADGSRVEVIGQPAGTHGYGDLRRDAGLLAAAPGLALPVASVADLARIAEASPRPVDRAWRPALRRLAERGTCAPSHLAHARRR